MNWKGKTGKRNTAKVTKIMKEEGNNGVIKDNSRIGDMKEKLEHQKWKKKKNTWKIIKGLWKRKLAKIMKKEPSGLVSAEFRSCLRVSPFGNCSEVWVCCKLTPGPVHVWPSPALLKLQATHSLWLSPSGLAAPWWATLLCKPGFYRHWVLGYVSKHPKSPEDPPLPTSACWPAVSLTLFADPTTS